MTITTSINAANHTPLSYNDNIDINIKTRGKYKLANFIIRGLDERVAQALRERAAHNGRSVEAELRAILEETLVYKKLSLEEFLLTFPNVGEDEDFARIQD